MKMMPFLKLLGLSECPVWDNGLGREVSKTELSDSSTVIG